MSTSLGLCCHSYAQNALLGHGKEIYYSNRGYAYVNGFPIFAAERTTPRGSHTKTKRTIATNPPTPSDLRQFAAHFKAASASHSHRNSIRTPQAQRATQICLPSTVQLHSVTTFMTYCSRAPRNISKCSEVAGQTSLTDILECYIMQ